MKILILTDVFKKGGLETHIATYVNHLKNHKVILGVSNYESNLLDNITIYDDFNFSASASIKDFCEDVNKIIDIIRKEQIDIIHVHPFYCLFSALFAAHLTNIPIVYTFHGIISFSFPNMINDTILFDYAFEGTLSKVFCVSQLGMEAFNKMGYDKTILLPNPIEVEKFKKTKIKKEKKWALVSRLDEDKFSEILKLFKYLPNLDIKSIDVYGTGNKEKELSTYAKDNNLSVNFLGFKDNIENYLLDNYEGIIGLSRVAIEAMCMNYPVLLIGEGKISGLINRENISYLKKNNFINLELPNLSLSKLNEQLQNIDENNLFRKEITDYCDITILISKYEEVLQNSKIIGDINIINLYKQIEKIKSNDNFYQSRKILVLIKKYIGTNTKNVHIRNQITTFILNDYDKYINKLEDELKNLKSENEELKSKLKMLNDDVYTNIEKIKWLNDNVYNLSKKIEDLEINKKDKKKYRSTNDRCIK